MRGWVKKDDPLLQIVYAGCEGTANNKCTSLACQQNQGLAWNGLKRLRL